MRWKNPCCNNKTQKNSWQIMENLRKQCRSKANQNNLWGVNHIRSTITSSCEGQDTPSMIQKHRELAFLRNSGTGMRGGDGEVEETKMVVTKKPNRLKCPWFHFILWDDGGCSKLFICLNTVRCLPFKFEITLLEK